MAQQDIAPTDAGDTSLTKIEANFTELYGDVATAKGDITDLEAVVNNASASAPASLDLAEDTDNGTNKITVTAPSAIASDKVITLPDVTGNVLLDSNLNAPRGFLLNGRISVTDSGSGLVVAVKTLAGTDPSATDPVYCRIGDTVRSITSALSRTLADGTNWMNAGSAEFATKEIDYFVYLVWDSNSSAVGLSFARIPYANLISDFSATTTNEKYGAGYSDFTTTDEVENIGRFAATLSAGAGYTWTVPTFTASNLIQRPIFETRILDYIPQFTNVTIGNATVVAKYQKKEKRVDYDIKITFGNTTSLAASPIISLPSTNFFSDTVIDPCLATCFLRDVSVNATIIAMVRVSSATQLIVSIMAVSGALITTGALSSTSPFTWTTGDIISISGTYMEA